MKLFSRDGIDYDIDGFSLSEIINYNELMTLDAMREILSENDTLCRCSFCLEDVFALSMNTIPPRYIQITSVERYINSPNYIDAKTVKAKVLEAWKKISKNPNH